MICKYNAIKFEGRKKKMLEHSFLHNHNKSVTPLADSSKIEEV